VSLLVGTEEGVLAVDDGGEPRVELAGVVAALHADEALGCWAVVDGRALARRHDDGRWAVQPLDLDAPITTVLPSGAGVLVGTRDARVARVTDGDATYLTGFDGVAGRERWHAVGSRTPYVRSMSASAGDGTWFASVHVGGIPRSDDGGETWVPTVEVDDDVHQVRAHPAASSVVMAAAAVGLLESRDAGATWSPPAADGLHATYLRALAFPEGAVVVSASDGPFGSKAALYRRDLAGGAFERCADGLPAWLPAIVDTGSLDARGPRLAAGSADTVYGSDDGGCTWRVLAAGLPAVRAVALVPGPEGNGR
jgi:photosystem II stability/assembly factor-like uncharacterized protein